MNVDVLNRSGVQSAAQSRLAIADCDIHPRTKGHKSLYPWLSQRWQAHLEAFGPRGETLRASVDFVLERRY